MSNSDVYIYDAVRTPRAKGRAAKGDRPGGALCDVAPYDLVAGLVDELERRHPGTKDRTSRLSLGCVGQIGPQGGHIALASRTAAGLPDTTAVRTLNNNCVSGLSAVMDAALWTGRDGGLALAGGVEMLSRVGFLADRADHYTDPPLRWMPPILGAEAIAAKDGIEKTDLDDITAQSHQRAHTAWESGFYDNHVIPVMRDGETLIDRDALIRPDMDADALAALPPAFGEQIEAYAHCLPDATEPRHSVANCPGMADGAALVLLGTQADGMKPRARVVDYAETAGDPVLQLTAGLDAMQVILDRQSFSSKDIDRWEFMEAFAAPPVKFLRDSDVDPERVNTRGGHLAMGHPMGATGAILLATLLHDLEASDTTLGMVVAQAGGGIGAALLIERV